MKAINRIPDSYFTTIHNYIASMKELLPEDSSNKRLHEILDYMNRKSVIINSKLYSTDILTLRSSAARYGKIDLIEDKLKALEEMVEEQAWLYDLTPTFYEAAMEKLGRPVVRMTKPKKTSYR